MKKTRVRLTNQEALYLGLEPKEKEGYSKDRNPRYMLEDEQFFKLKKYREEGKKDIPLSIKGTSTLYDKNGNIIVEWVKTDKDKQDTLNALKVAVETLKEDIEPVPPSLEPSHDYNVNLLNQYTLTDYHLGMMSWGEETGSDWNTKIAEDTLVKFFQTAIEQSPIAENAIFANIGDFLHWDGLDAVTPANKHVLDADTRFTKLVRVAIKVIRRIISMLLDKYQMVTVIMAEGNHDPASSVWLKELLNAFYENEPRVIVNTRSDPYYCVVFGDNCLFYHHQHKRRITNIDSVFVSKFKKEFGESSFVYAHLGHLHHDKVIETNLMRLEQHRTLASKDSYASRGGYASDRDSKVITYHKNYGEVGRNTINIKMIS